MDRRPHAIDYRWAEGRRERFAEIAAEFVRRNVEVIVTAGSGVPAIKKITSSIPIVFTLANDPIGDGLVASLARPGGNITGLSTQAPDLAGKRLKLLLEIRSSLRSLAILANGGYPASVTEMQDVRTIALRIGLQASMLDVRQAEDLAPAFESLKGQIESLYVVNDGLIGAQRTGIIAFAMSERIPTVFNVREFVQAGGLMSYGPNFPDLFRRAGDYVDKILKGAKSGDLPVEQPTKFELAINVKTAKALDIQIPPTLLALADEVIE